MEFLAVMTQQFVRGDCLAGVFLQEVVELKSTLKYTKLKKRPTTSVLQNFSSPTNI